MISGPPVTTSHGCLFCAQSAEATIPEGRVCRSHAIEFYEGLLAFAIDPTREIVETAQLPRTALMPLLPGAPGARPPRPYVKRHAKWFTTPAPVAA